MSVMHPSRSTNGDWDNEDAEQQNSAPSSLAPVAGSASVSYASGQMPQNGDIIRYRDADRETMAANKEAREYWIVTSIIDDMVRAKCRDAQLWRQAFFTSKMVLIERKPNNPAQTRHE